MPRKQILPERNNTMNNQKIILQLAQLLEKKELISAKERMKLTDIIRKGH